MPIVTSGSGTACSHGTQGTPALCDCTHKLRISSTKAWLGLEESEVHEVYVAHDSDCSIYSGLCCNCLPRIIMMLSTGQEIAVDEFGYIVTERMN